MRVKTTVLVAAIATMAIGAAAVRADQPNKRSVLRVSNNHEPRTIVRPVGFDDDPTPEPPIHQPPQVNSYTPGASRKALAQQQQAPRQMLPQRSQRQLFAQPVTRRVNHLEDADEGSVAEQPNSAAPAGPCCGHDAGCCGSPCGGQEVGCCGSPCGGHDSCCGASPCCAPSCCASPCCESSCCESSCCSSPCCGGGMPSLFSGHCGCGHHGCGHQGGCGHDCCGGCEVSCGCAHQHCGCGCGTCCQPCCCQPVDILGSLKKLFGPCCRCHSACHCGGCGGCGCGGCAMDYGCSSCGCGTGCSSCGSYGGGQYGAAGMQEGVPAPMPTPSNGSPSDVPPPPKVN